jgi:hypothetical protein
MRMIRSKLTYANVMATVAVFIALGGSAYAATQLKKSSVGTKQIKNNAVTAAKIKNGAITGSKVQSGSLTGTQINASTLGTVPAATQASSATTATTANALSAPEAIHVVNQPGQPAFEGGSENGNAPGINLGPAASFYKDKEGVVHLEGIVKVGKEKTGSDVRLFTLPPGFRPANGVIQIFIPGEPGSAFLIGGTGANAEGHSLSGVIAGNEGATIVLNGITFRAQS